MVSAIVSEVVNSTFAVKIDWKDVPEAAFKLVDRQEAILIKVD